MSWILLFPLSLAALAFKDGVLLALVMLSGLIISILSAFRLFKRRQFASFLFVLVFSAMYLPNPILIGLGSIDLEVSSSRNLFGVTNALLLLGLGLFFLGAYITKPSALAPVLGYRAYISRGTISIAISFLLLCGFLGFFIAVMFGGGWSSLFAPREALKAYTVGARFRLVSTYLYFPFYLVPILITQLTKPRQFVPWIITGVLLIGGFLLFRTRAPLITVLLSTLVGIILKNRYIFVIERPEIRLARISRLLLPVGLILSAMVFGGIAIRFLRGFVSLGGVQLQRGYARVWVENTFDGGDFGYTRVMRAAYSAFPSQHDFLRGRSYYRLFFIFTPRTVWPNKPENTQRLFCRVVNPAMAARQGTIPPSIMGDLYINFAYLGVLGMLIYGMALGRERYKFLRHWFILGGSAHWLVHLVRGSFTNPLMSLVTFVIFAYILERILQPEYEPIVSPAYQDQDQELLAAEEDEFWQEETSYQR